MRCYSPQLASGYSCTVPVNGQNNLKQFSDVQVDQESSLSKNQFHLMLSLLLGNMALDSGVSTTDGEEHPNEKFLNDSSIDEMPLQDSSVFESLFELNNISGQLARLSEDSIDKNLSPDSDRLSDKFSYYKQEPLFQSNRKSVKEPSTVSTPPFFNSALLKNNNTFLSGLSLKNNSPQFRYDRSRDNINSLSSLNDSKNTWYNHNSTLSLPSQNASTSFSHFNSGLSIVSNQTLFNPPLESSHTSKDSNVIEALQFAEPDTPSYLGNIDVNTDPSSSSKSQLLPMLSSDSTTTFISSNISSPSTDDHKMTKLSLFDVTFLLQKNQLPQCFTSIYKVFKCPNTQQVHNKNNCIYYHSQKDKRRHPIHYKAEQCDYHFDINEDTDCQCPNKDNCTKCHNRHELLYHPTIYKKRFCATYNNDEYAESKCLRGVLCAFAHNKEEMLRPLISINSKSEFNSNFFMTQFKTLWCPYGSPHDWHNCFYAHTYQDYRRSPKIGYTSKPCPQWKKDLHSADYNKRCPLGTRCPYSHGSKEQLYHPQCYKIMPCIDFFKQGFCPREVFCAFYHDIKEKRQFDIDVIPFEANMAYSNKCLSSPNMSYLQKDFHPPPPFNLDDFVSFGNPKSL